MVKRLNAVVAGHICLDVIPNLSHLAPGAFNELFQPGRLVTAGPALFSTGGPVSNTGLALHLLGIPTRLIARVGDDPFGAIVRGLVERIDPALADGLVTVPGEVTSYSMIVSPPDTDRIFLHCPGANDTFYAQDVDLQMVDQAALFHFGYPPVMRRMYRDGGVELEEVLRRARSRGATTSLDMSFPDPTTESGQADWQSILRRVLPYVDVFLPSFEELLFMLDRSRYDSLREKAPEGDVLRLVTPALLSDLSGRLLEMGARILVIKLGDRGCYLRTPPADSLGGLGCALPERLEEWADQELWAPCFQVDVVGTTGSGDATIAGFLSALLRGLSPRQALTTAVAVGACNVEAADALSGIRPWEATLERIHLGWKRRPLAISAHGWEWDAHDQLWVGPAG